MRIIKNIINILFGTGKIQTANTSIDNNKNSYGCSHENKILWMKATYYGSFLDPLKAKKEQQVPIHNHRQAIETRIVK
jgi:hypothetical protein